MSMKKSTPLKGKRHEDKVRQLAELPVKIYKASHQKAADKRRENKKKAEEALNDAARELDALLASVPTQLPSYQEMTRATQTISPHTSLVPPQGPVRLAEGMVHVQDVGVPLEPATVTTLWPAPEPVSPPPPPLPPPMVSPSSSSRSSPPLIQPSGEVLCPFHKIPFTGGVSRNRVPYMYCRDFHAVSFLGDGCQSRPDLDRCH